MNEKIELQLQAYVDGELSSAEATQTAALIERDAEARALYKELSQMSQLFKGNEADRRLPETREFYWSKIEREINRLESQPAESIAPWWLAAIRRNFAAFSGVGVATVLLLVAAFQLNWVSPDLFEEIDNPLDDTASLSFRSESQKMTVVWIADPSKAATDEETDPAEETVQ